MVDKLAVSPEQLKLMSFGPRREIIAALANDADLSPRDLALRLRRPVTGIYRHLNLLLEAGLVAQSAQRPGPKRPEALYALTFRVATADPTSQTQEGRVAVAEVAARYAAATARKFRRAVDVGEARVGVDDANARLQVSDLQLDRAGLVELNRLLTDFIVAARKLRRPAGEAQETVMMTIMIAPASGGRREPSA